MSIIKILNPVFNCLPIGFYPYETARIDMHDYVNNRFFYIGVRAGVIQIGAKIKNKHNNKITLFEEKGVS